jgi:hypothetical protein
MMCIGYDAGGAANEPEEPERVFSQTSVFQYFITIFNNSVGNINDPSYKFWKNLDKADPDTTTDEDAEYHRAGMVLLIWIFWVTTVIFLFIVLCNFLIAYISQSYEEVLEHKIQNIYKQRCTLNNEYYLFQYFLSKCFKSFELPRFNIFMLTADFNYNLGKSDDDHGNIGVIKKVQNTLNVHKHEITNEVSKNRAEMERVKDEMKKYRMEMVETMRDLDTVKSDITT